MGYIPGELSFAANSRELERTRANSARIRQQFADTYTPANVRRSTPNVRRSSAEFARVRPYSAANWRTVRQKIRSREQIPITSDGRSPWFAANVVRRERGSPRMKFAANEVRRELSTMFAANVKIGERVRQKFLENTNISSLSRTSSPPAN